MRRIFRWMRRQERDKRVLCLANFMAHIWLDDEELGWSTIAVTDGEPALADTLAEELADKNWAVRDHAHPAPQTLETAIRTTRRSWLSRKLGAVVYCDLSDIVAAGAPGENTYILDTLRKQVPNLITYIPMRDAEAARQCAEAGEGATVRLELGQKLEIRFNQRVIFEGVVERVRDTEFGKTAVVRDQGVHLFITELPNPAFFPRFFRKLGFSPWKADVIVVKNLFPFRFYYLLYNRKTLNVATSGTTNLDVFQLDYQRIPRPIYPLDQISDWRTS
jgi:microcystin degradation protein MlrC